MEKILSEYRSHPRVVERRLMVIYDRASRILSAENVDAFFGFICERHHIKANVISQVMASKVQVEGAIRDALTDRQELIFVGALYGEKRSTVATNDLGVTSGFLYQDKALHNPEFFITKDWLTDMDNRIVSLRVDTWYHEAVRFVEHAQLYMSIMPSRGE